MAWGERGRGAAPEARRQWEGPQLVCFFKNSVIWERVVINFQNPLPSPTFHTAPLLTALWFFRQDLRALIKPGALLTPMHARRRSVHFSPLQRLRYSLRLSLHICLLAQWQGGCRHIRISGKGDKGEAQAHGCREGWGHHFHVPLSFP